MSWTSLTGFLVVLGVLAAASAFGFVRSARDGRVRRRAAAAPAEVLSADDVGDLGRTATVISRVVGVPRVADLLDEVAAQAVGLGFAVVGLIGYLSGATLLGVVATAFALAAAFLNAAFGFCLGCEIYLLLRRLRRSPATV